MQATYTFYNIIFTLETMKFLTHYDYTSLQQESLTLMFVVQLKIMQPNRQYVFISMSKKSECDEMSNFKIIHNIEEHQTNIDLIYNLRKLSEKKTKTKRNSPASLTISAWQRCHSSPSLCPSRFAVPHFCTMSSNIVLRKTTSLS